MASQDFRQSCLDLRVFVVVVVLWRRFSLAQRKDVNFPLCILFIRQAEGGGFRWLVGRRENYILVTFSFLFFACVFGVRK